MEALEGFPWSVWLLFTDTAPRLGAGGSLFATSLPSSNAELSFVFVCGWWSEGATTLVILDLDDGGCCDDDWETVDGFEELIEHGPGAVLGLKGRDCAWWDPGTRVNDTVFSPCVGWEVGLKKVVYFC